MNPMDLQSFYSQDHERKEMLTMGVDLAANVSTVTAMYTSPVVKRRRLTPPPCERVMIYVRQENELVYTPLHLVPPTSLGLLTAVSGCLHLHFDGIFIWLLAGSNRVAWQRCCTVFHFNFQIVAIEYANDFLIADREQVQTIGRFHPHALPEELQRVNRSLISLKPF